MKRSPYLGAQADLVTGADGQIASQALAEGRQHIASGILPVTAGVWTVVGLSVANAHVIDAPEGLIVIDSGNGVDEGRSIRELIRTVSDRPIAALIYSHSHYCSGADGLLGEDAPPIYGHHRLHANLCAKAAGDGAAYHHRLMAQYGVPLPSTGPDADPIATKADKKGAIGYRQPTRTWNEDGLQTSVAGEPVIVHTTYSFDTDDSLILFFPERDCCCHNHVTATFPNIISVAGGGYRDPVPWLDGVDLIRRQAPEHLLGCHGLPTSGTQKVTDRLTAFRDALQFCLDQSIRGMTRGLTVDELLEELELPSHLQNDPVIAQSYAEWQFGIRGIYAGILSWYSGDAVDLHPVPPSLEAAKIVAGFGGLDATLNQVEHELNERCWAWAAKLARYCTRIAPEDERPRQLLATALRAMGHATQAWTTRNVYLTQAGEWERRWTRADLAPRFNATTANQSAPGTFVRALGHRLDPVAAADYDRIYAIIFNDCDHTCGLHIRRGVAEYLPQAPEGDHRLTCTRTDWLRFVFGEIDWPTLITHADVRGENWETLWDLFDDWPPRVRIP